jgi:hypothetical protein
VGLRLGVFPQSIMHAFAFLGLVSPIYLTIFRTVVQTAYRSSGTIITAAAIFLLIATIWMRCRRLFIWAPVVGDQSYGVSARLARTGAIVH